MNSLASTQRSRLHSLLWFVGLLSPASIIGAIGCDEPIALRGYGAPVLGYPVSDCVQDILAIHPQANLCLYLPGATYVIAPSSNQTPCTDSMCDIRSWQLIHDSSYSQSLVAPEYKIPFISEDLATDNLDAFLVFSSDPECHPPPFIVQHLNTCIHSFETRPAGRGCFAAMNLPLIIGDDGLYMDPERTETISLHYSQMFGFHMQSIRGYDAMDNICAAQDAIQSEEQLIPISWEMTGSGAGSLNFPDLPSTPSCTKMPNQVSSCVLKVSPGTQLSVEATPKAHNLVQWADESHCEETTCTKTISVTDLPLTIPVAFHPKLLPLTVSIIQDNPGSNLALVNVVHTSGEGDTITEECTSDEQPCTYMLPYNTEVALTGVHNAKSHIGPLPGEPWLTGKPDGREIESCSDTTCLLLMNTGRQVTAKFSAEVYAISIFPREGAEVAALGGEIRQIDVDGSGAKPLRCSNNPFQRPCVTYARLGSTVTLLADTSPRTPSRRLLSWGLVNDSAQSVLEGCENHLTPNKEDRCSFTVVNADVAFQPVFGYRIDIERHGAGAILAGSTVLLDDSCNHSTNEPCHGYIPMGEISKFEAVAPKQQTFVAWKTDSDTLITSKTTNPITLSPLQESVTIRAEFGFTLDLNLQQTSNCGLVHIYHNNELVPEASCENQCSYRFAAGTEVRLEGAPAATSSPHVSWKVLLNPNDDLEQCLSTPESLPSDCFLSPVQNTSVLASFTHPLYIEHHKIKNGVTGSGYTNIYVDGKLSNSCTQDQCLNYILCGSKFMLHALPDSNSTLAPNAWIGCHSPSRNQSSCIDFADEPRNFSVGFECMYNLTINQANRLAITSVLADSWMGLAKVCRATSCRYRVKCSDSATLRDIQSLSATPTTYSNSIRTWCRGPNDCLRASSITIPAQKIPTERDYSLYDTYNVSINRKDISPLVRVVSSPEPTFPSDSIIECNSVTNTPCKGEFLAGEKLTLSFTTTRNYHAQVEWIGCEAAGGTSTNGACTIDSLSKHLTLSPRTTVTMQESPPTPHPPPPYPSPCGDERRCPEVP